MTEQPLLEYINVSKKYGDLQALSQLNLKLCPGDFLGLVGPNGAGKTTAIHLATGLAKLRSGKIKIKGLDVVKNYTAARRLVGVAPQEPNFDRFFSVLDCLIYQGGYFGMKRRESRQRALELLDLFELTDKINSKPPELSGGQKRRLLLAKAVIHNPEIVILDEPTAGLDVELRHRLWDYLKRLKERGKTILLTTHYIEEVEALANRVAILNRGKLILEDKIEDVMNRYGRYGCLFKVDRLPRELAEKLEQDYPFLQIENHSIRACGHSFDSQIHEILTRLLENGIKISGMQVDETPLEEIFLEHLKPSMPTGEANS